MKKNKYSKSVWNSFTARLICAALGVFMSVVMVSSIDVKADNPGPFNVTEDSSMTSDAIAAMLEQIKYTAINVNNCTLTINGGISSSIPINIGENGKLVINGDYNQKKGNLGLGNNAEFIVSGDLSFTGEGYLSENMATAKATVGGNFIYASSVKSPTYVAGGNSNTNRALWTIGGDIIENTTEGSVGFDRVILNGESEQKISMQSGYIYNLTDSVSTSPVMVEKKLNSTKFLSNLTIKTGSDSAFNGINTNGNTIVIDGNLVGTGGITVAEGSSLTVNGDYEQKSGGLSLENNSVFNVNGNATFSNSGFFNGNIATASVNISGDLNYTSTSNSPTYAAGNNSHANRAVWNVMGSITQAEGSGNCGFNTLVLTGTGEQLLALNSNSYLDSLTTNESVTAVLVKGYLNGTVFQNDMTVKPDTGFIFAGDNAGGHNIVIDGDLIAQNGLNISAESYVTVKGNFQIKSGGLSLDNNAVFNVNGNATFSDSGFFNGNIATAKVYIRGDLDYTSTSNSPTYAAGNNSHSNRAEWSVTGSITQAEGSGNCGFNSLVLTGTGEQHLTLNSNSYLDNLTTAESVSAVKVKGFMNGTTFKNNMTIIPDAGFLFRGDNTGGNIITIEGDLIADNGLKLSSESYVTVKGDFQLKSGGLSLENNAVFTINGNATFSGSSLYYDNASTAKVYIGGDLNYTTTTNSPTYSAGNNSHTNRAEWSIAGNINQSDESGTFGFNNVILSGTGTQKLTLNSKSYFENLTVADKVTGVELNGEINAGKMTVKSSDAKIVLNGLLKYTVFESDANIVIGTGASFIETKINGHTLNVDGDMVSADGKVDLADFSTLNITGTLNMNKKSYMTVGTNGKVNISKDMVLNDAANIELTLETAKVNVGGNLIYNSTKASPSLSSNRNSAKFSVTGNVTQGEDAGTLNFVSLQMLEKNTSITLTNGHIDKLVLAGTKEDYTITPADCYTTLEENGKTEPEPEPGPVPGPAPQPAADDPIPGGGGATDTQPEITKETTDLNLVKGQKFVISGTWTSSDPSVVSISKGNVTVKKNGTATLTNDTQTIKVKAETPVIDKNDKTIKLVAGETKKANLTVSEDYAVYFVSEAPDIATVDAEGNVTGLSKGSAVIAAYVNGTVYKFCAKVADTDTSKRDFSAEVKLVPNQTVNVKYPGFVAKSVVWDSDTKVDDADLPKGFVFADDIVKINKSGKMTAIGSGTTKLTADCAGNVKEITVTVSEPVEQSLHLNLNATKTIKPFGVKGNLAWNAEDDIVSININKIKGIATGNTVLTANYENFTYKVNVYVEDPSIKDNDFVGKPYSYTLNMKAGETKDITFGHMIQDVVFISNKNAVAYAGSDLKIHARTKGQATLKAKVNGKAVQIKVIVSDK